MPGVEEVKNPMIARGLAGCNCLCSLVTIILITYGVVFSRNFKPYQLRNGPMKMDPNHVELQRYPDWDFTAKTLYSQLTKEQPSYIWDYGSLDCNYMYNRYITNESFAPCLGVYGLGNNSKFRFPTDDGFIYPRQKQGGRICDDTQPGASQVFDQLGSDPIDLQLGVNLYRAQQTERYALYAECMSTKLGPYATLVWCVLYFIGIAAASIAFAFSPRPHKSMLLVIAVALLLVTLLQVYTSNTTVINNRRKFRNCDSNSIENVSYYSKLPPTEYLVDRESSMCELMASDNMHTSCPSTLTLINPQKLTRDCSNRTAICQNLMNAESHGAAPKDWFGEYNFALNKTIKWDEKIPKSENYRWCAACTEGAEDSSVAWDIKPEVETSQSQKFTGTCPVVDYEGKPNPNGYCFTNPKIPGRCSVAIQSDGLLKVMKFDIKKDTLTYLYGSPGVNLDTDEYTGTSGPAKDKLVLGGGSFSYQNDLAGGTVAGFKICIIPSSLVPSLKPGGGGTSSFVTEGIGYTEDIDVWMAPSGDECAWSSTALQGDVMLGGDDMPFLKLDELEAQTCVNKHAKGLSSFPMSDDSYNEYLIKYGSEDLCFDSNSPRVYSGNGANGGTALSTLGRSKYPECVAQNYENGCFVKRVNTKPEVSKDVDNPIMLGGSNTGDNTCVIKSINTTTCVCRCTDADKALGFCKLDQKGEGTEILADHPLYSVCKDKAVCKKEDERTTNDVCVFLGASSDDGDPSFGQKEARRLYIAANKTCESRQTTKPFQTDYCKATTQTTRSPYFTLFTSQQQQQTNPQPEKELTYIDAQSFCKQGERNMDLAMVTSLEEEKSLAKKLYKSGNNGWIWTGLKRKVKEDSETGAYIPDGDWERSDGVTGGPNGKKKTAPSYILKSSIKLLEAVSWTNAKPSKCTAGLDYPEVLSEGDKDMSQIRCSTGDNKKWTCADGMVPVAMSKCVEAVPPPTDRVCTTNSGYTCMEGGTITSTWVENDYFPFHGASPPSGWKYELMEPPPVPQLVSQTATEQYAIAKADFLTSQDWPAGFDEATSYKVTGLLKFSLMVNPSQVRPDVVCREHSAFSENCVIDLDNKCISMYTECSEDQEEHFNWMGQQYKHTLSQTNVITAPKMEATICITDYDGTFMDWTAYRYFQGSNSLITGLIFGYFTLFFTSLLACQMALATGDASSPPRGSSNNNSRSATPPASVQHTAIPVNISGNGKNLLNPLNPAHKRPSSINKSSKLKKEQEMTAAPPPKKASTAPIKAAVKAPSAAAGPPPPAPPGSLPAGWSEFKHDESGKPYFYNATTQETVWIRPTK